MFHTLGPLTQVTLGGDSNMAFDSGIDKSKPLNTRLIRPSKASKASVQIARLIFQSNLADIWRELNPTTRDFTHFSNTHQSYSRIDHILLSFSNIPSALTSNFLDMAWSDHSMVTPRKHTSPIGLTTNPS